MLCFDCYCQKGEEWGGWDRYFLNLAEYQAAAIRHHVPFWIITLALGHWIYRAPTVPEMLRQFNTALAYGAQGILYFLYRAGGDFGYGAPVDELGQRGPLYYQLKRQHTYFRRYWESRYRTLKPTLTSHFPTAPAGTHLFNGTGIAKKIGFGVGDTDILVGEFVDDQQRPHVMIVNNNTERHVSVGVDCVGRKAYHLGEKGEVPCAESASGLVQVGGFLMPAAAQLYRIEPGT
jgi:hypothetical protein